jgi:predicted ArsR family transcriptional regulator
MIENSSTSAADRLQQQARALGDPTRHEIFRYIARSPHRVDIAELTAHVGLHHNAIRQHLARLLAAELVVETTSEAAGRGRPRLRYSIEPTADSRWGVCGPYEKLALLLSEVIRSGDPPVEVGRRSASGTNAETELISDPAGRLVDQMARYGFDPSPAGSGDEIEIVLRTCPFETAALVDPDTVCDLHLGIAHGIAASVPGLVIDDLVRRDPRQANCVLRCHIESDDEPTPDVSP